MEQLFPISYSLYIKLFLVEYLVNTITQNNKGIIIRAFNSFISPQGKKLLVKIVKAFTSFYSHNSLNLMAIILSKTIFVENFFLFEFQPTKSYKDFELIKTKSYKKYNNTKI